MKYMLIFASAVALAVASPHHRGLVDPDAAGPASNPEFEPIAIGPADLEQPVIPAPAPVFPEDIVPPVAPVSGGNSLVQIIIYINGKQVSVPGIVGPQPPDEVAPADPVHVVDSVPESVDIGTVIVPEPVAIGVPLLPYPAAIMPEELN